MSSSPDWMEFIKWEQPVLLAQLVGNRSLMPTYNGFYAFNLDRPKLIQGRVLYIGECDRIGGLRSRFYDYLKPDPTKPGTTHLGALFLQDFRLSNPDTEVFVRWCPFETDKATRRNLEAAMMQYYQAWFNTRDMRADTPFDTI